MYNLMLSTELCNKVVQGQKEYNSWPWTFFSMCTESFLFPQSIYGTYIYLKKKKMSRLYCLMLLDYKHCFLQNNRVSCCNWSSCNLNMNPNNVEAVCLLH